MCLYATLGLDCCMCHCCQEIFCWYLLIIRSDVPHLVIFSINARRLIIKVLHEAITKTTFCQEFWTFHPIWVKIITSRDFLLISKMLLLLHHLRNEPHFNKNAFSQIWCQLRFINLAIRGPLRPLATLLSRRQPELMPLGEIPA